MPRRPCSSSWRWRTPSSTRSRASTRRSCPPRRSWKARAEDWWTIGRRVRVGRAVERRPRRPSSAQRTRSPLCRSRTATPSPERSTGSPSGGPGWSTRATRRSAGFSPRPDFWQPATLTYETEVTAGGATLRVTGHDGGDVDWFTADAHAPLPRPELTTRQIIPHGCTIQALPLPAGGRSRTRAVDIGGFPPDRSHLATAASDRPDLRHTRTTGSPCRCPHRRRSPTGPAELRRRRHPRLGGVKDSFDDVVAARRFRPVTAILRPARTSARSPGRCSGPPGSTGRPSSSGRPRRRRSPGRVLDDVILGVDEDANVLWAVELRADGLDLALSADSSAALEETRRTGTREFTWLPSTTLPPHWHPYRIDPGHARRRVFVQGLVADLSQAAPEPRAGPRSCSSARPGQGQSCLGGPEPGPTARAPTRARPRHRRHPVLWRQRRRVPVLAGPVSHLRFDLLREQEQ